MKVLGTRFIIINGIGDYSQGGYGPTKFSSERPKYWSSIGAVKNHLNLVMSYEGAIPADWRIHRVQATLDEAGFASAKAMYEVEYKRRMQKKERDALLYKKKHLQEEQQRIEKELKEL